MTTSCSPCCYPTQAKGWTIPVPSAISAAQYQAYIVTSLLAAETCPPPDFQEQVETLWAIMAPLSGCDLELQYLLTRQQAIKILMGCYVRQIDTRIMHQESHQRMRGTSTADGWAQASNTMASIGFAEAVGENRYRDIATGSTDSATDRTAFTNGHTEGHTHYSDTGSGVSAADTTNRGQSHDERREVDGTTTNGMSRSRGARAGCNYTFSDSLSEGSGFNIYLASWGRTPEKHNWNQWIYDDTQAVDTTQSSSLSRRKGDSQSSGYGRHYRASSNYFNALTDGHDWSIGQTHSEDHSTGSRDSLAHAQGIGHGNHESKDRADMSSQASSKSREDRESHSKTTRVNFLALDDVRAHQRFQHLRQLYDNTVQLIAIKRDRMRKRFGTIVFGELLTCSMDGFCRVFPENAVPAPPG